jgi:hypothetical protein
VATDISAIPNRLEEMRVFSQLSGSRCDVEIGSKRFVCIGGLVLPHQLAKTIMIAVCFPDQYVSHTSHQLLEVVDLNAHDPKMSFDNETWGYVYGKIRAVMREWTPDEWEGILVDWQGN